MKQLEVTILGQSYLLGCPDGGEIALLEAVGNVDREMSANPRRRQGQGA